jgi:hypothetical protein
MARAQTTSHRITETPHFPPVQASLGAAQAEYRGLQLVFADSRHQRVQRAEIGGLQFQPVHRGSSTGEMLKESVADGRDNDERRGEPSATSERRLNF